MLFTGLSFFPDAFPAKGAETRERSETVWNGTVTLGNNTNIPQGDVLRVEAGTVVELDWNVEIYVHGTIIVEGTWGEPVTFKRIGEDRWGSIHIYQDSSGSLINNTLITGGEYGVRGDGGTFTVRNSKIFNCKYGIGAVANSDITVVNSTIDYSLFYSVFGQASSVTFNGTTIGNKWVDEMYLSVGCTVVFIDGQYNFGSLSIQDANTKVYRCWTADVHVRTAADEPVEGAKVKFERNNLRIEYQGETDSGGEVRDAVLTQMIYREVGPTTFNPFKLTVEKIGYETNIGQHHIDASKEIVVTLLPGNRAPVLQKEIGNFTAIQNKGVKQLADLRGHFEDDSTPDNLLDFSVNFNSAPGDIDIYVAQDHFLMVDTQKNKLFSGSVASKVIAEDEDGGSTVSNKFFIHVKKLELPPEIAPIPSFEIEEDGVLMNAFYLYDYVNDPDTAYEDLDISLTNNSHGSEVEIKIDGDAVKIIPGKDYYGIGRAELTATDGNHSVSRRFHVNVTPKNDAPNLTITSPETGDTTPRIVSIKGDATDVDGDPLTLIVDIDGEKNSSEVSGRFEVEVDLGKPAGETATLIVKATDGVSSSNTVRLELTVESVSNGSEPDADTDGDGIADNADDDDDNDGVPDVNDDFPLDPAASKDSDGDGYPDEWNPGMENGSTTDLRLDEFPNDPREWEDYDQDGVGNNADDFPADPAASVDSDGDGSPDRWNSGMTGNVSTSGLGLDAFPLDPAAALDSDGDGYPDAWNPGKNKSHSTTGLTLDHYPYDPSRHAGDTGPGSPDGSRNETTVGSPGFLVTEAVGLLLATVVLMGIFRRRRKDHG